MTGACRKEAVMRWRNESVDGDCPAERGWKSLLSVAAYCPHHLY